MNGESISTAGVPEPRDITSEDTFNTYVKRFQANEYYHRLN